MISIIVLFLILGCLIPTEAARRYLALTNYYDSGCTKKADGGAVLLPFDQCQNNHNFNKVDCHTLGKCLGKGNITYADLITCTGAPSMYLSVNVSYAFGQSQPIKAHVYTPLKTCRPFGIAFYF